MIDIVFGESGLIEVEDKKRFEGKVERKHSFAVRSGTRINEFRRKR